MNPCPMEKYLYFSTELNADYTARPEFNVKANGTAYTSYGFDISGITDKNITVKYFVWEKEKFSPLFSYGIENIEIK